MKKILLSIGLLTGLTVGAQDCSELFISEYVEGWSNNKALEIYNPTDQPIDLSDYIVIRYSNGSMFASEQNTTQLTGTLGAKDVYVAVLKKLDPNGQGQEAPVWDELQAKADGFYNADYDVKNTFYFNGNDAVVLAKGIASDPDNATAIDIFGKIGEDPATGDYKGWSSETPFVGVGADVTSDHSLIRKPNIKKGVTANPGLFDPLAEWDSLAPVTYRFDANGDTIYNTNGNPVVDGNWGSLGSHICDCGDATSVDKNGAILQLSIAPNPSSTGVFKLHAKSEIIEIEVYNSLGERVFSQKDAAGIQTVNIGNQSGVYLINIKTIDGAVASRRLIVK